jgi:hypothetical protein
VAGSFVPVSDQEAGAVGTMNAAGATFRRGLPLLIPLIL